MRLVCYANAPGPQVLEPRSKRYAISIYTTSILSAKRYAISIYALGIRALVYSTLSLVHCHMGTRNLGPRTRPGEGDSEKSIKQLSSAPKFFKKLPFEYDNGI